MHLIPTLVAKANKYNGSYHWIRTHWVLFFSVTLNENFLRDPQNFGPLWVLKWLLRLGFLADHTTPPTNFPSLSRRHHHVNSSSLPITTLRCDVCSIYIWCKMCVIFEFKRCSTQWEKMRKALLLLKGSSWWYIERKRLQLKNFCLFVCLTAQNNMCVLQENGN